MSRHHSPLSFQVLLRGSGTSSASRQLVGAVAAIMLLVAVAGEAREPGAYPERPIRLILPSTPGSPPDLVGRVIGEKLSLALGQPVVFENRPGATGIIGLEVVVRAPADGYTLGVLASPHVVMASLVRTAPFDVEKDLTPIVLVDWTYNILAVPQGSSLKSVADLIAVAKERPGALKFSSGGKVTPSHLAGELFGHEAGVSFTHVPYKGSPEAVLALLSGQVDFSIAPTGALSAQIKAGKVRALATNAPHRLARYQEIPTFAEVGYPTVMIRDWQGIVGPAGVPKAVVDRLYDEVSKIVGAPDVRQRLEGFGMEVADLGPSEFGAGIREERSRWNRLVRDGVLQVE